MSGTSRRPVVVLRRPGQPLPTRSPGALPEVRGRASGNVGRPPPPQWYLGRPHARPDTRHRRGRSEASRILPPLSQVPSRAGVERRTLRAARRQRGPTDSARRGRGRRRPPGPGTFPEGRGRRTGRSRHAPLRPGPNPHRVHSIVEELVLLVVVGPAEGAQADGRVASDQPVPAEQGPRPRRGREG